MVTYILIKQPLSVDGKIAFNNIQLEAEVASCNVRAPIIYKGIELGFRSPPPLSPFIEHSESVFCLDAFMILIGSWVSQLSIGPFKVENLWLAIILLCFFYQFVKYDVKEYEK